MIVWSGFGFLVPIIMLACMALTVFIARSFGVDSISESYDWPFLIGGVISAPILWFLGNALRKEGDGSSFFFIPIRWWSIGSLVLGCLLCFTPSDNSRSRSDTLFESDAASENVSVGESQRFEDDDEEKEGVGMTLGSPPSSRESE